jgi:hypothetical protein
MDCDDGVLASALAVVADRAGVPPDPLGEQPDVVVADLGAAQLLAV